MLGILRNSLNATIKQVDGLDNDEAYSSEHVIQMSSIYFLL